MLLGYMIYGIRAISKNYNGGTILCTAVILYPKYERMNNHSHYAACSQLQSTNENASINPCY